MIKKEILENSEEFEFDIAISFAGEDRKVAEELTYLLIEEEVSVFYDLHTQAKLWGKDLYQHLQSVYRDKARYCIILVSQAYAQKLWTRHELKQAQARAFRESREYILPLRIDDTEIPELNHTVAYIDLRTTDLNAVCDLVLEKLNSDDPAEAVAVSRNREVDKSNGVEEISSGKSIIDSVVSVASTKAHRLLVFWIQLVLINLLFFGIVNDFIGNFIGIFSLLLVFPISIAISRLVNRDAVMSVVIGGLVIAMLEGGLMYYISDWAAKYGIFYGAFYGVFLTSYFSNKDKQTNLFWAAINTFVLIAIFFIIECPSYGFISCLETLRDRIGKGLTGAGITIIFGLILSPALRRLTSSIETFIEKMADLDRHSR